MEVKEEKEKVRVNPSTNNNLAWIETLLNINI